MTIIRLSNGGQWVHSPAACTPDPVAAAEGRTALAAFMGVR